MVDVDLGMQKLTQLLVSIFNWALSSLAAHSQLLCTRDEEELPELGSVPSPTGGSTLGRISLQLAARFGLETDIKKSIIIIEISAAKFISGG